MEFHKILIAIDKNSGAETVALNGLQLARQFSSEIALVSIIDTSIAEDAEGASPRELDGIIDTHLTFTQQMLIETVFKGYPVKTFVEKGNPYEVILKIAEQWGADVIVMGTHGRKGFSHLILGSVAEDVIRHSKRPLVVIPILQK